MPPKNPARFPRTARLLRHADFERVYKLGLRHYSASMTVFYLLRQKEMAETDSATRPATAPQPGLRVGFTVSRALGGAVQRNRMKRRLREAVRMSGWAVDLPVDVVINPKKSLLVTDFAAVLNEVSRAFVVIKEKFTTRSGQALGGKTPTAAKKRVSGGKPEA